MFLNIFVLILLHAVCIEREPIHVCWLKNKEHKTIPGNFWLAMLMLAAADFSRVRDLVLGWRLWLVLVPLHTSLHFVQWREWCTFFFSSNYFLTAQVFLWQEIQGWTETALPGTHQRHRNSETGQRLECPAEIYKAKSKSEETLSLFDFVFLSQKGMRIDACQSLDSPPQKSSKMKCMIRGWVSWWYDSELQLLLKHECSFESFKKEYRALCARIQKRYGCKASTPFNIKQVNNFLDRKESMKYI